MAAVIVFVAVLIVTAVVLWAIVPRKPKNPAIPTALRNDGPEVHFEEPRQDQ